MSQTQVQSGFIGDNSVTATQIADGAVTTAKIADNSITTAKIADQSVTTAKLDSTVSNALVPIGGIIMWSGTIEAAGALTGWKLCNGENGTPNLQDRFVVGASSGGDTVYPGLSVRATGGSADAIVVSHSHTGTTGGHSADHSHNFQNFYFSENNGNSGLANQYAGTRASMDFDNNPWYLDWATAGTSSNHTHDFTTSNAKNGLVDIGASAANANLPPYYALAFIMRIS
jgi:hypothetical protein